MDLKLVVRDRRHARWVKSARNGDERAFTRLYDELYGPVAGYLRTRCADSQDADDLISTVFHRFLQNLERFDPRRGCVLGWLLTMARHALIDHLRRGRPTVPIEDLAEQLAGSSPDPLEGMIRTEQADLVLAALTELPADTREILALHYGRQLRLRHIGDLLGLSEAAVKQRLSRARRELRRRLRRSYETAPAARTAGGNGRRQACLDETG